MTNFTKGGIIGGITAIIFIIASGQGFNSINEAILTIGAKVTIGIIVGGLIVHIVSKNKKST